MKLIDFSATFIFTVLNIGILFIILRAILFKPVTQFIEKRAEKIKADLDGAASNNEEAKRLRCLYEEKIRNAEEDARVIAENARKNAELRAAELVAEGKAQAEILINAARKQITAEQQAAYLVFKAEAASLVVQAASRLLRRQLSGEEMRRLAENAVNECAVPRIGRQL